MGEVTRYPWEQVPAAVTERTTEETVRLMQADLLYMTTHTSVTVHSNQPALEMLVNTPRGQIVPRGECKFRDGSTIEFQDIGMPQVGAPIVTVRDLMARVWSIAAELGLELI